MTWNIELAWNIALAIIWLIVAVAVSINAIRSHMYLRKLQQENMERQQRLLELQAEVVTMQKSLAKDKQYIQRIIQLSEGIHDQHH